MGVVYVTSQNRKAGKTMVSMALACIASDEQSSVSLLRIGVNDPTSGDLETVLGQGNIRLSMLDDASVSDVVNAVKAESSSGSLVVVDSSGDMSASDHVEIVDETKAKVLLVSDFRDKDSSLPYAQKFKGNILGILINCLTAYGRTEAVDKIIPSFQDSDVQVLGLIPEDRTLLSLTVGQISELLGGRFFTGAEYSARLVENFMVGG
ncbi:MAG: hypothetical protein LR120_10750, partial [Dehalococcoidia bacterium]|nr:hypothetical protein [Dehalococcoidia bacterium]